MEKKKAYFITYLTITLIGLFPLLLQVGCSKKDDSGDVKSLTTGTVAGDLEGKENFKTFAAFSEYLSKGEKNASETTDLFDNYVELRKEKKDLGSEPIFYQYLAYEKGYVDTLLGYLDDIEGNQTLIESWIERDSKEMATILKLLLVPSYSADSTTLNPLSTDMAENLSIYQEKVFASFIAEITDTVTEESIEQERVAIQSSMTKAFLNEDATKREEITQSITDLQTYLAGVDTKVAIGDTDKVDKDLAPAELVSGCFGICSTIAVGVVVSSVVGGMIYQAFWADGYKTGRDEFDCNKLFDKDCR